jgi:hypothetical protein
MKSEKKRPKRSRGTLSSAEGEAETTFTFWMPKDLAVAAWNMAAEESLSFNDYCIKLLLEDEDRLQKEEKAKIVKFSA